ncbi:MAG: hypothetical protein AB1938_28185 [Myxococcota bacterium]
MSEGTSPPVRVRIELVIQQAVAVGETVAKELPTHDGLRQAVALTEAAARKAHRLAEGMKRPWSPHRLPVVFLAAALLGLMGWLYWQFFHVSTLSLALPDRDAVAIKDTVASQQRLLVKPVEVPGSREAVEQVSKGAVDLAFVQGGVPIPPGLLRLEAPSRELVLFFLRDGVPGPAAVTKVLTSVQGEGSHSVALDFFRLWRRQSVGFVHEWKELTSRADYQVPPDVQAVFVVKDPTDEKALVAVERLAAQGFRLASPVLGVRAGRLDYLAPFELPRGHLRFDPALPEAPVSTFSVSTFLVARDGLTPRHLTQAAHVLDANPNSIRARTVELTTGETSELFQGIDAFLSILLNIGLAFLALLGLDVVAYRRPFHELNSLVSVVAMLQSNKDVLGVRDEKVRSERLLYLGLCSDLLSLISSISGYYTQENSSLLFNNLSEVVHSRCDALKLNIQLKVLHATVPVQKA